jgi:glycine dehydrogenase
MTHLDSPFAARHIGPSAADVGRMLTTVGYETVDELMDVAIP